MARERAPGQRSDEAINGRGTVGATGAGVVPWRYVAGVPCQMATPASGETSTWRTQHR
jgi:hypothetical protein